MTSAELAKLYGMELCLGRGKRDKGNPELALVGLGVFSSLVKFVDIAHN